MNSTSINGTTIAHGEGLYFSIPRQVPETLVDLESCIKNDPTKIYRIFAPTFRLLEEYCQKDAKDIKLVDLFNELTICGFRPFLRNQIHYSTGSVNTHVARFTTLRKHAKRDYHYEGYHFPEPWRVVIDLAEEAGCSEYADHFARITKDPGEVTTEAAKELTLFQSRYGYRSYTSAVDRQNAFLRLLRRRGYTEQQPLATARENSFGTPVKGMPPKLKDQTERLRLSMVSGNQNTVLSPQWKPQPWDVATEADLKREEGSGSRRERTADLAVGAISRIHGYLADICDVDGIDSMELLITKDHLYSFRNFSLRFRRNDGDSVRNPLAVLFAALRRCKQFPHIDLSWADELLDGIPRTPPGERAKRKDEHYLPLDEVDPIADMIRVDRQKDERRLQKAQRHEEKLGDGRSRYRVRKAELSFRTQTSEIARLVMAEFIYRFLTTWPWRGENLCKCRVKPAENPNLFSGPVKRIAGVQVPPQIAKVRDKNPDADVWQVHIPANEHKTGRTTGKDIDAFFPWELVGPLEEWLKYRANFLEVIKVPDPGTLLINERGKQLSLASFERLVKDMAVKYANAPMNPHLFRDAIADECLERHPQDSEHVAKGMFHSSDKTLKRSYATRHNASVGTNFLDAQARVRREKREKQALIAVQAKLPRNASRISTGASGPTQTRAISKSPWNHLCPRG